MIKKRLFKYSSVLMCVVLSATALAACGRKEASTGIESAVVEDMGAGNVYENTFEANTRQEKVYIFADAAGKKEYITVNEKVTDENGKEMINKTTSSENEPITMKITYRLDGKEISADKLAGKSGRVSIRFDYTNNVTDKITVNGKESTVYVPFTMITGVMLPTDKFSNVEITNGKLSKVGEDVVAVGMTMPGLKETISQTLNGEEINLDVPEYVEVTADVQDFELDMTMSVATTNLLSDIDADNITIDELKAKVEQMEDAGNKLSEGSDSLASGTQKLNDSIPALTEGISQLDEGAKNLESGIYAYTDGVNTVKEGADQLSTGLDTLYASITNARLEENVSDLANGAASLNAGTQQLKNTLTANMTTYSQKYGEAYNYGYQILGMVAQQSGNMDLLAGLSNNAATALTTTVTNMSLADDDANKAMAQAADETMIMTARLISVYNTLPGQYQSQAVTIIAGLNQASTAYYAMAGSYKSLNDAGYFEGMAKLAGGLSQMNAAVPSLCSGITQLKLGAGKLSEGTDLLTANNDALNTGAGKLSAGTSVLKSSSKELADGVSQLNAGAITLKDGMIQFNEEAIEPLSNLVNNDADKAVNVIKEIVKVGQNYDSFLDRNDGKKSSVTFIYKTAEITAE